MAVLIGMELEIRIRPGLSLPVMNFPKCRGRRGNGPATLPRQGLFTCPG